MVYLDIASDFRHQLLILFRFKAQGAEKRFLEYKMDDHPHNIDELPVYFQHVLLQYRKGCNRAFSAAYQRRLLRSWNVSSFSKDKSKAFLFILCAYCGIYRDLYTLPRIVYYLGFRYVFKYILYCKHFIHHAALLAKEGYGSFRLEAGAFCGSDFDRHMDPSSVGFGGFAEIDGICRHGIDTAAACPVGVRSILGLYDHHKSGFENQRGKDIVSSVMIWNIKIIV